MEGLSFGSPKWVYMLKSVEKKLKLCKTRKYKTVVGGAILVLLPYFEVLKKSYFNYNTTRSCK
jgi:hypothetical protein